MPFAGCARQFWFQLEPRKIQQRHSDGTDVPFRRKMVREKTLLPEGRFGFIRACLDPRAERKRIHSQAAGRRT